MSDPTLPHSTAPWRPDSPIRLGTRGSPLAMVQARLVAEALTRALGAGPKAVEIVVITTTGDRIRDRTLADLGGKGLFTKEIDEALADGRIDVAVHSMKDLPTVLPDGQEIGAVLPREDPRDAWLSRDGSGPRDLAAGSVVGTASLRRAAQILALRPDLRVETLRGNVETRMRKLKDGVVDATMLAEAGLRRLERADVERRAMSPAEMLPAVAQGAIAVTRRLDEPDLAPVLNALGCPATTICVTAERAMLARLDGSCRTPIAGLATLTSAAGGSVTGPVETPDPNSATLVLRGLIAKPDGSMVHRDLAAGPAAAPQDLGEMLGQRLLDKAGPDFLGA